MQQQKFPDGFVWGAATAAYQIEGAVEEDGRKPCVWDLFSRQPGRTTNGETGRIACDHYHRFHDDVKLLADLGVKDYRLSISWPRIMPDGRGKVNEKGIDFYKRLFDALGEQGITPWTTLFHWDSPGALEEEYGSWQSRRIADDFADYCTQAIKRLGDRCTRWWTINEIECFTLQGYGVNQLPNKAPGTVVKRLRDRLQTVHHALLAHGKGVQAIRAATPQPCQIGLVENVDAVVPVTETEADIDATWKAFRRVKNGSIAMPALLGRYDEGWLADQGEEAPQIEAGDLQIIHQPLDMLGLNVYTARFVRAGDTDRGYEILPFGNGHPRMGTAWLYQTPDVIYWATRAIRDALGVNLPIYITETGCATDDVMTPSGEVFDTDRLIVLRDNLRAGHRAIADGYPLKGVFVWSLMDNFEWEKGYSQRFGIVHNHYETQTRTPKLSATWYSQVMRENRVV